MQSFIQPELDIKSDIKITKDLLVEKALKSILQNIIQNTENDLGESQMAGLKSFIQT